MRAAGPGSPEPLGVALGEDGANVAVYSAHAAAIELCLFDAAGARELERIALPSRTGNVHHGFVPGLAAGARYGLRAHGPYEPWRGQRFNPAKLLVDPYATALDRPFVYVPALGGAGARDDLRDGADSAPFVPKAIAIPALPPARTARPRIPWADMVVYELHVRGYTRLHPDVPEVLRGTCAGLAHPAAVAHLERLGVTTVELMPLAAAIDERHLARLGLRNYWGYNPVALFVPDPRLAPGGMDEVRACVEALHQAGIEVLFDVVLNHTGEGDERGPTVSLRGLDNATYYRTRRDDPARYADVTGCGNTVALDHAPALRLAMDALRHWALATGADGFRFDLATALGRRDDGFDPAAPLLQAIAQDPVLRDLKLVAEPWDVGPGGHQLGAFPADWGEWNDRYRDAVRRYWRGDSGCAGDFATRLAGSADIFAPRARQLSRSVNFVTAHDGFTARDLVSYSHKHNAANGEDDRDGTDVNYSWNHGVEGDTADPAVRAARLRDVRSLLATLLCSHGTPMLAMGDELGRTQRGNNNAYAQDGPLAWVDWAGSDRALAEFVASVIAVRARHPALRGERPLADSPCDASGIPDVEWRRPDGRDMGLDDWNDHDGRVVIASLYAAGSGASAADRVVVACNAGNVPVDVRWPEPREGRTWQRCIDTSRPEATPADPAAAEAATGTLGPRSLVVLEEADAPKRARRHAGIEDKVLDRLVTAADIAPEWHDVEGRKHVVGVETRRALLAAMGLGVTTTDDARARLRELADANTRRPLPSHVVARPGLPTPLPLFLARPLRGGHATLRIRSAQGSEAHHPLALGDLTERVDTAADGQVVRRKVAVLPPLDAGEWDVSLDEVPGVACRVVVAPERCHLPRDLAEGARRFGLAAHLYALRRQGDHGIGDFTALARLGVATARAGGSVLAINPLHALFAGDRDRASPYHPSDRRHLDPIYVDLDAVPDLLGDAAAQAILARERQRIAALSGAHEVDYAAVWRLKQEVLAACFARFRQRGPGDPRVAEFERFVAAGGASLAGFAAFEAIAATRPREPWQRWPADLRRPDAAGVDAFSRREADRVRFALYLQWLAEGQLRAAAAHAASAGLAIGLLRDLAIGAAPDGAEAWANSALNAQGVSVGAPPDPFSPAGQNWNLPPPNPHAQAATGADAFRELLAANMRHAGALRIDHVMGLERLFWIPDGARPAEGSYVRSPFDLLLAVLALESERRRCLVIGEDLGTVPDGFRERLMAANVLSYRVLWFERENGGFVAPSRYPARAAACVSTHDLPTVAGWWSSHDIEERHALGLLSDAQAAAARDERRIARHQLVRACTREGVDLGGAPGKEQRPDRAGPAMPLDADALPAPAITAAVHRYACASRSALVLLQADDLAGETVALNLPGTDGERANWRRKLSLPVEALWTSPLGRQAAADFAATRGLAPADVPGN